MVKRPTVLDLFSGCGGMSLGFESSGFDIAASIEFDAIHCLVHHFNFSYSATICNDIANVSVEGIYKSLEDKGFESEIDVVVGGPPCQGFSQIGKRVLDDPRNRLVFEFHRIVQEIKPKYFVFENVPGIASGAHKAFLDELISEFHRIGYSVVLPHQILDASLYGVPQKRRRLFLIGYRANVRKPSYPSPTHGDSLHYNHELFESMKPIVTSHDAISDLEDIEAFKGSDLGIDATNKQYSDSKISYNLQPSGHFSRCHIRELEPIIWGHVASNHTELSKHRFSNTEQGTTEKISRFYKLHTKRPCLTIRAGTASDKGAYTAPRPVHYKWPRCITIREAARLHGFPDWFQFHRSIWHGFREIGNAVAPLVAKNIGDELIRCLGISPEKCEIRSNALVDTKILSYNMGQASSYWGIADDVIPKRKKMHG